MNNRKKAVNCLISFLLSAVLVFSGILGYVVPAQAEAACAGTITVAVERFSIGQGYLIEPCTTTFQEGDTYKTICRRILEENGYSCTTKGSGFYLSGINGADAGKISIPECISKKIGSKKNGAEVKNPPDNNAVNKYAGDTAWLGEWSYSDMSGWMYSVGNDNGYEFPGSGMDGIYAKDGDVFRLQFTVWGYGEDLTGRSANGKILYYEVGDKTALTRKIAQINRNKENWFAAAGCQEAYNNALTVLQKLDATQAELDAALSKLPAEEPVFPSEVTLDQTAATLYPDGALQLKAVLSPKNVNQTGLTWSTSNSKAASVDQNGLVEAKGIGTADITVKTQNGKTAVCHVTVKDRPITKINLNMTAVSLEIGENAQLKVVSYEPENATEKLEVTFSSDNADTAEVDADGLVTAQNYGTANITAVTKNGVSAVCRITVATPEELARAMEDQIKKLPEAGQVTDDNAAQVIKVWQEYTAMSDAAKAAMNEDAAERLETLRQEAETVVKKQEQVKEVRSMLEKLPSAEQISLSDESSVQKARSAYNALDASQQKKIDDTLKTKLSDLEKRISALKTEADAAGQQIQAFADQVTVKNAADALKLWKQYSALAQDQKNYLGKTVSDRMEQIGNQLITYITDTAAAVNRSGTFNLNSAAVQNFITVSNICEDMDQAQMDKLSAAAQKNIEQNRQWIGDHVHVSGNLSVSADWYVRLVVKNGESSTALKNAVKSRYSSIASIAANKIISYEDIRTGKSYTPKTSLKISADLSGLAGLNNPVADTASVSGTKITLQELESQYKNNIMTFSTKHTGTLLIIDNPIAVTGISVPSAETVGIGSTISLDITYKPFNATTDKTVVLKSSDSSVVKVTGSNKLKGLKPGSVNVTVSLKSDPSIKAVCRVTVTDKANKLKKSVKQVMKETSAYISSIDKNPTIGSEWFVLGLARSGKSLDSSYFKTYYNHVANYLEENDGKLTNTVKYTEYSKQILALTAIGKDARNIAGYNLFENLADFDLITRQGFNGPIWALIALKSNPEYTIPKVSGVSEQTTEAKLVNYLLAGEIPGGGWALEGSEPDVDVTAMTLQALAPYYHKKGYEKVTAAIDRAVEKLSDMQLATGGFGTMGTETLESNAQVITALCALGIDPQTDARFIKNGRWTVENLISYHVEDSGFMHVKEGTDGNGGTQSGVVNGMATEQGYYALTAYQRFCDGKTSLYDMSDMTTSKGEKGDGKGTGMSDPKEDGTGTSVSNLAGSNVGKHYSLTGSSSGQNTGSSASGNKTAAGGKTAGKKAGKTAGKTAAKTSSKDKKDEKEKSELWSFDGKTYIPDTAVGTGSSAVSDTVTEQTADSQGAGIIGSGGILTRETVPYVVMFVLGAALGAGVCVLVSRRKKPKGTDGT